MNWFKKFLVAVVDGWRLVLDNRYNPLRFIRDPSVQTYFTCVLFVMWCMWFGLIGSYYVGWFGYSIATSIIVHLSVLVPIALTNGVFLDAERDGANWVKEWRKI